MEIVAPVIDEARLARIKTLKVGAHESFRHGACAMEAVAYIAREPWSDQPECACPVISAFMRAWNDALPDADRTRLLLPLVPRLVGTRSNKAVEERRALMAADWLVRTHTPAWLRLAGLTAQAEVLEGLLEITSMAQVPSIRGPLEMVCDVTAAWTGVKDTAEEAAKNIAWDAVNAAGVAAVNAAAGAAVETTVWDITYVAAVHAARAAAVKADLKPAAEKLQTSSLALVERMIECREAA